MAPQVDSPLVKQWKTEIDLYERTFEKWCKRSKKIIKKYKDIRTPREDGTSRYNILWSNVQTRLPALYARDPKTVVERRFRDRDPVGRVASDVLERATDFTITHCNDFRALMRQVILDEELPGRGLAWVRYVPHFKAKAVKENADTANKGVEETDTVDAGDELEYEKTLLDYVYWEDFGHTYARVWEEVRAGWRKVYLTYDELKERFTELTKSELDSIPLDWSPKNLNDTKIKDDTQKNKRAVVYEIWDKQEKEALWLCKGFPKLLDQVADPLELENFFPFPRPLYATLGNDDLVPVPNYAIYQDQASELDDLTTRINAITKILKVVGVRDTSAEGLDRMLAEGVENQLIPIDGWIALKEKGGIEGVMELLPLKEIAETLGELREQRQTLIEDIYQLTGMSDIIRGEGEPNETATAQQIKGQFACLRISDGQTEVQRFCRDVIRIVAQLVAGYSLDTLKAISGVKLLMAAEKQQIKDAQQQAMTRMPPPQPGQPPPQPPPMPDALRKLMEEPSWEDVIALLANSVLREFRIDIETDSTIRMDEDAEREARLAFLKTAGDFLNQVTTVGAASPETIPMLGEMFLFGIRAFRVARSLEQVFEDTLEKLQEAAKQKAANPPPSPEEIKANTEIKIAQMKAQLDQQTEDKKQQAQAAQAQQENTLEAQRAQADAQLKLQLDGAQKQHDEQLKGALEHLKEEYESQRTAAELASKQQIADADNATKIQIEAMRQEHEKALEAQKATHEQQLAEKTQDHEKHMAKVQGDQEKDITGVKAGHAEKLERVKAEVKPEEKVAKPAKAEVPAELTETLKSLAENMSRPRKVNRDKDGRIASIE